MMMSNPPSALQQRQRLHRRQNSTPVAFEALKVPNLPTTTQRPNAHRRGQSLDQRTPRRLQQHQAEHLVSITNPGQQILREAQQQRIIRPGQHQISIPASPSCGPYASGPGTPYDTTTMNALMAQGNMQMMHPHYFGQEMNMPMSAGLEGMGLTLDENNQHYFQNLHGLNHTMMDERRMSQPDLRVQTGHRPFTPDEQIHSAHFPLTPAATPFHHQYARSLQSSPIRQCAEAPIQSPRPISMQRGRSLQGIVENEQQLNFDASTSSAPIMQSSTFDYAEMPVPERYSNQECHASIEQHTFEQAPTRHSPLPTTPPARTVFEEEPLEESLPFFDETGGEVPHLSDHPVPILPSSSAPAGSMSPTRPALSPRRISITDLHLEPGISASIEETNITLDDIAQFIEGPGPSDNKWVCIYEDCGKKFGRKENIKSHVQTHLGDRQFRCDHCKKCFVRGHDLKRHAKIHTGTKPYPCLCGNSFARHDALTRHRQRGMCIGAFDGVVKKDVKRGRPRKHRPEMDDRMDKANRTRRKANELHDPNDHGSQYDHYASSASSDSMSSWGSPPTETMENLSIRGGSPFDDMALFGVPAGHDQMGPVMESVGLPPNMFSFTPPTSPGYSTGQKPSPSHHSQRSITPTEMADLQGLPTMPIHHLTSMAMQHSQQSLPSLSHSSSSPAADVVAFDFSEDPITGQVHRMGVKEEENVDRGVGINDFDRFLDYGMGIDGDSFFAGL